MKLNRDGARRRMKQSLAAVAAAVLLAACGGGDRLSDFKPVRVIAFGDESSVLDDSAEAGNARKYSVNPVFSATVDCHTKPNWVQYVAEYYRLYFPQCSKGLPAGTPTPSLMLAAPNASVADVKARIDAFLASDALSSRDLVTVYVGVHDVLNQYAAVKAGGDRAAALAAAEAAGALLATQVNRLADAGGRVLLVFLPGMEYSPFAAAEEQAMPGAAALLKQLTQGFNQGLLEIYPDGRKIGVALLDGTVESISRERDDPEYGGSYYDYAFDFPVNRSACLEANRTPNLLTCTSATAVSAATNRTDRWLWADDTHLSASGQGVLGDLALRIATENPF